MNIKKPLLVAGAIATVGLTTVGGAVGASAATASDFDPADGLMNRIATHFNLNKDEVAEVFKQDRVAHEEEEKVALQKRLDQAVKDGKLTDSQKDKIMAKVQEMRDEGPKMMTIKVKDGKHNIAFEQKHDELEAWAKKNNIPMEYLRFHGGMKFSHKIED